MTEQFFGKLFFMTFAGVLLAALLGFLALGTSVAWMLLGLSAVIAFTLTWKRTEYGLLFAFGELFSTSHGHLVFADLNGFSMSLRMAIFVSVMLAWTLRMLTHRSHLDLAATRSKWDLRPWILLSIAVLIGLIIGFARNPGIDVFKDGNAYGYLLYLFPLLTVTWTRIEKRALLQVLAGSAAAVSTITLALLYAYTHLSEPILRALYTFVRDARLAELTRIAGDIFRIFLQAQFSVLVLLFLFSSALIVCWKTPKNRPVIFWGLAVCLSVMIISLSRSFWVGMIAGGCYATLISFRLKLWRWRDALHVVPTKFLLAVTSLALLWIVIAFPVPPPADISVFGDILKDRTTEIDDSAISSRWNLLPEMLSVIKERPLTGSGFGTKVAFESDDPRVRAVYPDGKWRTYSFEWGWLDAWLKMGLLGPVALLWIGWTLLVGLLRGVKGDEAWLSLGLTGALVALYTTHIFSPYLNHPIGIGFLVFLLPFVHRPMSAVKFEPLYEPENPSILRLANRPLDPTPD